MREAIIGLTGGSSEAYCAPRRKYRFQVCDNIAVMKQDSNLPIAMMKADSGLVENEFLIPVSGGPLEHPCRVLPKKTSAYGAALLLHWRGNSAVRGCEGLPQLLKRYEPQMSGDERHYRISEWHRAVNAVGTGFRPNSNSEMEKYYVNYGLRCGCCRQDRRVG